MSKLLPWRPFVLQFTFFFLSARASFSVPNHKQRCSPSISYRLALHAPGSKSDHVEADEASGDQKTKTNKKQEKGGRNSFLIIPLDVFHTRSRLRDPRCPTGRRWSHVTTVCRSCEGTMCRNLSCQNDRHISSCRHQNRELQVTKSGEMAAFFFFFLKKVAAAFSGRNFWEEKNLKELVGKFLSNSPCDDD